ncbi:MAG TPA: hypothetical protein VG693_01805, partial [Actinomycetes bacterium]|nr:hypothetical protein [Actinomycetes bacterium]
MAAVGLGPGGQDGDPDLLWAQQAHDPVAVFAEASRRLRRLVPFDAAVWLTTDPGTGLPTTPSFSDNLEPDGDLEQCSELWRREFLVDDVNLYRDLARAEVPAAGLRATVADPSTSAYYREFLDPMGFADELRAVLRVGDSPWGAISLFRPRGLHRRHRRRAVPLHPHGPRPRQGYLRHGRRHQPGRAGSQAVPRLVRAHPPPGCRPGLRQLTAGRVTAGRRAGGRRRASAGPAASPRT